MNKLLIVLASVLHLIPHPFGVSPVGATGLYAGAKGDPRIAWLVPLIPLFLANVIFGFYDPRLMAFVYLGFALSAVVGRLILAGQRNSNRYAVAVVSAAMIFFLISNFAVWYVGMYSPNIGGLIQCYLNGLPFLAYAIAADFVYTVALFELHSRLEQTTAAPVPA